MRDIDLFVGVASVGNDPNWIDSGGMQRYHQHWDNYSFRDLSKFSKNGKEVLMNLIPRLKIRNVAEVRDKFVVVKGKLRTYKIHIGSTNILMEPNDRYLCIVSDRTAANHAGYFFGYLKETMPLQLFCLKFFYWPMMIRSKILNLFLRFQEGKTNCRKIIKTKTGFK